jgi:phenylacetate-CoA ligase
LQIFSTGFAMSDFYDALETRSPEQREADCMASLPRRCPCAAALQRFCRNSQGVDASRITSRAALATCP